MRRLVTTLALLSTVALGSSALARPAWMQEGKAGIWMFNFKIGPAIAAKDTVTQGAIVFELGVAVDRNRSAYIILPVPQFQANGDSFVFANGTFGFSWLMIPIGFQYDIPIKAVPGLYLSPALSVGYALGIPNCNGCSNFNAGFVMPEFSAKFIFARRWNVGFEPFGLPIFIAGNNAGGTSTSINYRLLFYGGVNF